MKNVITFSLDADLVIYLDKRRGMVSRSAFVEDLIKKGLGVVDE